MRHTLSLFLTLTAFWGLMSGHSSILMLLLGAVSITCVLYIAHRMDVVDHESQPIHLSLKIFGYFLWLFKELVIANMAVVKSIWLGNASISPVLVTIKSSQVTDVGKVIYANSITMTPGTVTVDLVGDRLTVHALFQHNVEVLNTGEMDRRVCHLESKC
ncbi:MAG: cation transporter [Shewanella sp.]|nr:Na+/H+ antiporter subunit E [Shewanella sp.]PHQ76780.1 MAG: cation transporter [Shewanella sp.]